MESCLYCEQMGEGSVTDERGVRKGAGGVTKERGGSIFKHRGRDLRGEMCSETGVEISGQIPPPLSGC